MKSTIKILAIAAILLIGTGSNTQGQTVTNSKGEVVATVTGNGEVVNSAGYIYLRVVQDSILYAYHGDFWGKLINPGNNQLIVFKGDREYIAAVLRDTVVCSEKGPAIGYFDATGNVYDATHKLRYKATGLRPEIAAILGLLILQ